MPKIEASTVAEHRAMREQQVLGAAADLLLNGGSSALTPAAVAAAAKISRTSIYHYFPSGSDLLLATLEYLMEKSVAELEAAMQAAGPSPLDKIEAYVRASLSSATAGYCAGVIEPQDLPTDQCGRLREWHDRLLAPLIDAAERCKAPDSPLAARLVQGMIDAAARAIADGNDRQQVIDTTLMLLRAAFSNPHAQR